MARKSKLTDELLANIETSIQAHNSIKTTCDLVGISEETFYKWMRESEGTEPDAKPARGLKAEFSERVKRAQAMSKTMLVNEIRKDPSWQAKAWILERQHPKEFGRRQLVAHAGHDGETPMPTAAASPVNLVIRMAGTDEPAPWVFKADPDPEPETGTDPWESEEPDWTPRAPAPEPPPDEKPTGPPPRGPKLPPRQPQPKPAPPIAANPTRGLDTGGRPRDPDA